MAHPQYKQKIIFNSVEYSLYPNYKLLIHR